MKSFLILLITLCARLSFGQAVDSSGAKHEELDNYEHLRTRQKESGIDKLTYVDSTFNFQVQVPDWLHLRDTKSAFVWGGTLPAVEGIENAIVIKAFRKSDYKSLKDFRNFLVEGLEFGHPVRWSQSHLFMGKKPLGHYKNVGDAYKVYIMQRGLLYHCEYILLETKTAYLWIDYTATETTFDKNIGKFEEFMSGFKAMNF
ncbi:hypothetical protein [Hymenobacter daeguensis]